MDHPPSSPTASHSSYSSISHAPSPVPSLQEFSLLKAQNAVLKKAVLEEQTQNRSLLAQLKVKEQKLRETLQQLDLQTYHNETLTKRIESMREDMKLKASRSKKNQVADPDVEVLSGELESKILENEQLHQKLSDALADVETFRTTLEQVSASRDALEKQFALLQTEKSSLTSKFQNTQEALSLTVAEKNNARMELDQTMEDVSGKFELFAGLLGILRTWKPNNDDVWIGLLMEVTAFFYHYQTGFANTFQTQSIPSMQELLWDSQDLSLPTIVSRTRRSLVVIRSIIQHQRQNLLHNKGLNGLTPSAWDERIVQDLESYVETYEQLAGWIQQYEESSENGNDNGLERLVPLIRIDSLLYIIDSIRADLRRHWAFKLSEGGVNQTKILQSFGDSRVAGKKRLNGRPMAVLEFNAGASRILSEISLNWSTTSVGEYWRKFQKSLVVPITAKDAATETIAPPQALDKAIQHPLNPINFQDVATSTVIAEGCEKAVQSEISGPISIRNVADTESEYESALDASTLGADVDSLHSHNLIVGKNEESAVPSVTGTVIPGISIVKVDRFTETTEIPSVSIAAQTDILPTHSQSQSSETATVPTASSTAPKATNENEFPPTGIVTVSAEFQLNNITLPDGTLLNSSQESNARPIVIVRRGHESWDFDTIRQLAEEAKLNSAKANRLERLIASLP
ncbi:hypothetical protein HDU76_001943 [Blyttiomyces sp. JEL0837]|nr:hypothetical protein HDU76_001943 [Blyttiomyces sp. JEL0837]